MTTELRNQAPILVVEGNEIADLRCAPKLPGKLNLFCPTDCIVIKTSKFVVFANVGFTDGRNSKGYQSNLEKAVEQSLYLLSNYDGLIDCKLISVSPFSAFSSIKNKGLALDPDSTEARKYPIQKIRQIYNGQSIEGIVSQFCVV